MSTASKASITDYKAGEDTIKLTAAPSSVSISDENAVIFDGKVTVANSKGEFITYTTGGTNSTKGAFYGLGSVESSADTTAVLYSTTENVTVTAGTDFDDSITAVDASAAGAVTFSGFTSISGMKDSQTISLASVNDAKAESGNLIINDNITIANAAESIVSAVVGNAEYKLGAGVLANIKDNTVSITGSRAAVELKLKDYGADFTSVDATAVTNAININAGENTKGVSVKGGSVAVSIQGSAHDDTLTAGAGNVTLTGGDGKDIFVLGAGTASIADYTTDEDTIRFTAAPNSVSVSDENVIFDGKVTVAGVNGKFITYTTDGTNSTKGAFYGLGSVNSSADTTAVLYSTTNDVTVTAGTDFADSITAVDATAAGDNVTLSGFTSISGMNANQVLSLSEVPTVATVSGSDLVISGVTVKGKATSEVKVLVNNSTSYVVKAGLLYNEGQTAVSLLSGNTNYDAKDDTTVTSIVGSDTGATIKGGATTVTIQGGSGADSIVAGTGGGSISGGEGADTRQVRTMLHSPVTAAMMSSLQVRVRR